MGTLKRAGVRELPPGWVSAVEAAAMMGVDAVTLEFMRKQRTAPTWALLNGDVPIYRREGVREWVRARA
jgi:hypothetical protein